MNSTKLTHKPYTRLLQDVHPLVELQRRIAAVDKEKLAANRWKDRGTTRDDINEAKARSYDSFNFRSGKQKHLEQLEAIEHVEQVFKRMEWSTRWSNLRSNISLKSFGRLVPELPILGIGEPEPDKESLIAGVADAVALAADGNSELVIDWKSDVQPDTATRAHYRQQVQTYLRIVDSPCVGWWFTRSCPVWTRLKSDCKPVRH